MDSTIRGRTRPGRALRIATVILLLWSLIGASPAGPAWAANATAQAVSAQVVLAQAGPDCPPATADGQVIYGCNELSRNMQDARLWLNKNKRGQTSNLYQNARRYTANYAMARLSDGTYIIGHSDADLHAEERLLQQMRGDAQRVVWDPKTRSVVIQPARAGTISALYTELEPCARKCDPLLANADLRKKTTWSWKWNAPRGSPTEAVKEVQDRANNFKTGAKPIAIKQLFRNGVPGRINGLPNVQSGVTNAIQRQATARPLGGIDFSSIQLRYVSDGATGGNKYAFRAPATPGRDSTDGAGAILDSFEALNVWMTLNPSKFWVNLNPGEPNRIIDKDLAATDVGHVLLQSDLDLKESGAKLIDPSTALGKKFWDRMDAAGLRKFCTRNWIVPMQASVRESGSDLYILDAPLEVKSEGEDFQLPGSSDDTCPADSKAAVEIYRSVILPELTRVVNESPEYTDLRRVFISRVAAEWYRQRMAKDGTAADFGVDSNDASTLESAVAWNPKDIFDKYVKEINGTTYTGPDGRVIITGGVDFTQPVKVDKIDDGTFQKQYPKLPTVVQDSVQKVTRTTDDKNAFAGGADVVPAPTTPPTTAPSAAPTTPGGSGGSSADGSLPITGTPIMAIAGMGVALTAFGVVALLRARRRRVVFESVKK
jgi:hypothetical protein